MKTRLLTALAASLLSFAATAHDYTLGALKIGHPYARETPPSAAVGSAYLTIDNTGTTPDRLVAARTERSARVEIHTMVHEGAVMKMRELKDGIPIPAGAKAVLEPGGNHLMLMGLTRPLAMGERVPVVLTFEKGGEITVELAVQKVGDASGDHGAHGTAGHK